MSRRGAVLEGIGIGDPLHFEGMHQNYNRAMEERLARQRMAMAERARAGEAAAENRKSNYQYGVKKIENPELLKDIPYSQQPAFVSRIQGLKDELAKEFLNGGNLSMEEIDMKYGRQISELAAMKAGMQQADQNIKDVAAGMKSIDGVSPERAENFLRKNVFKQDGTIGAYDPDALMGLIDQNAGEVMLNESAVDKFRKGLGVTNASHSKTVKLPNGRTEVRNFTSSLNEDMFIDKNGDVKIKGDDLILNVPAAKQPVSVAGVKLSPDEQVMAQVALKGATGKDVVTMMPDQEFAKYMAVPSVGLVVKARVNAMKDHYKQTQGDTYPSGFKMDELLQKAAMHELMTEYADAKTVEVKKDIAAPAPKITINNNNAPAPVESRDYYGEVVSRLKNYNQEQDSKGRKVLSGANPANYRMPINLLENEVQTFLIDAAREKKNEEGKKNISQDNLALFEKNGAVGLYEVYTKDEGRNKSGDLKGDPLVILSEAAINVPLNQKYIPTTKPKVRQYQETPHKGISQQQQSGKVKVVINGATYEVPRSSLSQMDKDGVKYQIKN